MGSNITLTEYLELLLREMYPSYCTTTELVRVVKEHPATVWRALIRLEHRGQIVRFDLPKSCAWATRSLVGAP